MTEVYKGGGVIIAIFRPQRELIKHVLLPYLRLKEGGNNSRQETAENILEVIMNVFKTRVKIAVLERFNKR